jgi:hypothetical protein
MKTDYTKLESFAMSIRQNFEVFMKMLVIGRHTEKANRVLTGSSSVLHTSPATLGSVDRGCSRAMELNVRMGMRRKNRLCIPENRKNMLTISYERGFS